MPTGPRGEKRPADLIGAAVMVGRIAVGELDEHLCEPSGKVRSGLAGAKARSEKLNSAKRVEISRLAAGVRWR